MSLQARVLEVLEKQTLVPAKEIGGLFPDVERIALDCCLNGLVQSHAVTLSCGNYSAVRAPGAEPNQIRVTAPVLHAPTAAVTSTRSCRECRQPKPLEDYPEIGPQKRRGKTCNACRDRLAQKKQHKVMADGVYERAKQRRQEALNRLEVLKVDIANLEAVVGECDRFIELYGRFAAEGYEPR